MKKSYRKIAKRISVWNVKIKYYHARIDQLKKLLENYTEEKEYTYRKYKEYQYKHKIECWKHTIERYEKMKKIYVKEKQLSQKDKNRIYCMYNLSLYA